MNTNREGRRQKGERRFYQRPTLQSVLSRIRAGCPPRGVVLDPFMGSGTTAVVALKQRKHFIGIELNPAYIEIAKARLRPMWSQKVLDVVA